MTLQSLFLWFTEHRNELVLTFLIAPWLAWLICLAVPGKKEEPYVLSVNMSLALVSLLLWVGYLAYANSTGGWSKIVKEADFLLLLVPPYYVGASIWLTRTRLSLSQIYAFRLLQGLAAMAVVYLVLGWFASKVRFFFISYIPYWVFLVALLLLLGLGYWGFLQMISNPRKEATASGNESTQATGSNEDIERELEQLRRETYRAQYQSEVGNSGTSSARGNRRQQMLLSLLMITIVVGFWGVVYILGFDGQRPSPVPTTQPQVVSPQPQQDSFQQAVNQATEAANLTQTAKTAQEWETVASLWLKAIENMAAVPESSPKYQVAQQKAAQYRQGLAYAQKNAQLNK